MGASRDASRLRSLVSHPMNDTILAQRRPASTIDLQAFRWGQPLDDRYVHDFSGVRSLFVGNSADTNDWRLALDRIRKSRACPPHILPILLRQLNRANR